jgi:hypothetical protein
MTKTRSKLEQVHDGVEALGDMHSFYYLTAVTQATLTTTLCKYQKFSRLWFIKKHSVTCVTLTGTGRM